MIMIMNLIMNMNSCKGVPTVAGPLMILTRFGIPRVTVPFELTVASWSWKVICGDRVLGGLFVVLWVSFLVLA